MKHVIGNTPHCITCKYFVENTEHDKNECDGFESKGGETNETNET